jgi:GntR family transcriptional regulator
VHGAAADSVEAEVQRATRHEGEQDAGSGSSPATARALPRFLDQCLDESLQLVRIDHHRARARRPRRRGDAHRSGDTLNITMLDVKVNRADPTDLYDQVAGEIRRAIANGEAQPGERLPPAKDLAAVLGVNTNTVFRALRLLRDEGLLEFRRGRGISVAGTPERGAVVARVKELVDFARRNGYRRDELVRLIEELG